jgi:branched-chain amino acid transport system ATP-binding protein
MSTITVANLDAGYSRVQILHQISMAATTGEVTCIFGPNGCGKSTLFRAMVGAIDPWGGRVLLDDDDITHLPPHQVLRRGVALMPQGGGVFPQLTVRNNLRMGGYTLGSRSELSDRIDELPTRCDSSTFTATCRLSRF